MQTGPETHWVCYYNNPKYKLVEYFDPFGEYNVYENMQLKNIYIFQKILKVFSINQIKSYTYCITIVLYRNQYLWNEYYFVRNM